MYGAHLEIRCESHRRLGMDAHNITLQRSAKDWSPDSDSRDALCTHKWVQKYFTIEDREYNIIITALSFTLLFRLGGVFFFVLHDVRLYTEIGIIGGNDWYIGIYTHTKVVVRIMIGTMYNSCVPISICYCCSGYLYRYTNVYNIYNKLKNREI